MRYHGNLFAELCVYADREANKMSYPPGSHYHVLCMRPNVKSSHTLSKGRGKIASLTKRLGKKVSLVPPLAAPPTFPLSPEPLERKAGEEGTDLFKDPAKLVLVKAEEAQRNRKQAETRIALEKIHDRIKCTLNDFEGSPGDEEKKKRETEVNLELVEDPAKLYELISDSRLRSKYQQNLTVFIVGYEEKCEARERVLGSLNEFFEENQSGGTQQLLDQLESEEVDFDDVTSGLESAMETAQSAAERLLKIKKDMSQLIAIVAAFPDTKKGRKKMEKALLKAQEEVEELSASLGEVKGELETSQERCGQLQSQIEVKTQECSKLRPLADKAKLLQVSNESVKKELESLQKSLEQVEGELRETKKLVPTQSEAFARAAAIAVDSGRISELESELEREREKYESLTVEKEELASAHQAKVESLKAEHEVEIQEMRGRYEEQMKSLMEDDLFEDDGDLDEEEEGEGEGRQLEDESFLRDIDEGMDSESRHDVIEGQEGAELRPLLADGSQNADDKDNEEEKTGAAPQEQAEATPLETTPGKEQVAMETEREVVKEDTDSSTHPGGANEQGLPPDHQDTTETTPIGTPPHKPRPPSPSTSTASGSTAGSIAGSMRGRRMSKAIVGKIQKEFESREKKLKHDLDEVKVKSRKAVTSLKAQLAECHSRHAQEIEGVRREMEEVKERMEKMERENEALASQVEIGGEENERLSLKLKEKEEEVERFRTVAESLQQRLAESPGQRSDLNGAMVTRHLGDVVRPGSPQWSEQLEKLTPRSVEAAPLLQMDEVFQSGDGQSLASGSVDLTLPDNRGVQFLATSLDQSMNSAIDHAPLGSPLQSASMGSDGFGEGGSVRSGAGGRASIPMQYSLGMLAQSRLSHHSPGPQGVLGFDHPIVMEWSKAYETVIKFKDNLVDLLSSSPGPLAAMADDLRMLELHQLDRSGDVQGQITEMRFSLALMLHQIEQTLQDTLGMTDSDQEDSPRPVPPDLVSREAEDFHITVARLRNKLRDKEQTHLIEIQESKETIANLSSKIENLKIEMAKLRQSLPHHMGGAKGVELEGGANIMFTRLDAERNTKTLQKALEKEWISPSLYNNVTTNMADYLTIPGRRLAVLAQRCHQKHHASSLLRHISESRDLVESDKSSKVMHKLHKMEHVKHLKFVLAMDRLTAKRTSLANDLTHTLTHIEKKAGVFLIKPIYSRSGMQGVGSLITPIDRPRPLQPHPPSRGSLSRPKTRLDSGRSTPHPNMKLVSQLVRARQQTTGGRSLNAPPHDLGGSGSPPPHRRHLPSLLTPPLTGEWCVGESRLPPPPGGHTFVNPLSAEATQGPLMPRIMEMDILRKTQTDALLGHILPDLVSRPSSKAPPYKLNPLDDVSLTTPTDGSSPEKPSEVNQIKANVHFDVYHPKSARGHTHLPPIRVPSRTDHDRPLPVH